jgi:hypothetical protein
MFSRSRAFKFAVCLRQPPRHSENAPWLAESQMMIVMFSWESLMQLMQNLHAKREVHEMLLQWVIALELLAKDTCKDVLLLYLGGLSQEKMAIEIVLRPNNT